MISRIPALVAKELLIEWRERSRLVSLLTFGCGVLLMVAFAMPHADLLQDLAGLIWVGLLLASARSLDQSFHVELENGALEGMVLWPVDPVAIFYGKAIANAIVLVTIGALLTPLMIVLYNPPLRGDAVQYAAILVLGCAGLAAPGTLVAALTAQARGGSGLLPLLFFPLVVPVLMASSRATTLLLEGDPMDQVDDWLVILAIFNAVHWSIDGLLFSRVVDDS